MKTGSNATPTSLPPRWQLTSIYESFEAANYQRDIELLAETTKRLVSFLEQPFPEQAEELATAVKRAVVQLENASDIAKNLAAYASTVYSVDTREQRPVVEINRLETLSLPLAKAWTLFRQRLIERAAALEVLLADDPELQELSFFLRENLKRAQRQMTVELEDLAKDLERSGGEAWSRLQDALSSTAEAVWDTASGERKNVIALRNLAFHADRSLREKAYQAELAAWKSVERPLAAALNGVKGWYLTLNGRRGWDGAINQSLFQARLNRRTLDALINSLEDSLPAFRAYLKAKARLLGLPHCAFYDLFAPVGELSKKYEFAEAGAFIVDRFSAFDPAMGNFARNALEAGWIDAESRPGKVGGAYCCSFPLKAESRILCNFEGSFSSLITVAHEMGHAWHHEMLKDVRSALTSYPMTMAETASIFAETLVFEDALRLATPAERLGLIESSLKDSCQVIVDILSRYLFETAIFQRRGQAELSADDFCRLMLEAQKATYGDGLDPDLLHPYMWAVKSHYYRTGLAFYNFPYAFGLLFGLGLYARFELEGPAFAADYRRLLRQTGRAEVVEVARSAGFDLESSEFWQQALGVITKRIDEFISLVDGPKQAKP